MYHINYSLFDHDYFNLDFDHLSCIMITLILITLVFIKIPSTIMSVSGTRSCNILSVSGPRIFAEPFLLFLGPRNGNFITVSFNNFGGLRKPRKQIPDFINQPI